MSTALRHFIAFCGVTLGSFFSGCASLPNASPASSDGVRHECAVIGTGRPIVVFESGVGETMTTWDKVFADVGHVTTAFAYSRLGYGGSGSARTDRDGDSAVKELRALLAAKGLPPPYILVGHSLGGLYVELYAKRYPSEVAGVVLVDPTPVDHLERLRTEQPTVYAIAQTMMTLQVNSIEGAEQKGISATSQEWHAAGPFPRCPAIVLTGAKSSLLEGAGMIAYKEKAHAELVAQWPGAQHQRIESGHFIQRDKPEVVIAAIKGILARIPTVPSKR